MNDLTRCRFEELKAGGLLPSPRGVAQTILEMTTRKTVALQEIVRTVQVDPALAGRILRYANAAHGGGLRSIVSVDKAIRFLGLFRVRQIALGFSLIEHYRTGTCPPFNYEEYWTTSLASAIAAQQLASLAQTPPDESFSCGLLSGIGRLALATAFPAEYADILRRDLGGLALIKEERNQFGIDHAHLSAEMLEGWGLPEIFTEAVRHHEQPAELPSAPGTRVHALCATLNFALKIGQLLNLDETQRWERIPSLFNAAAQLGVEEAAVAPLVDKVVAVWQGWAQELGLPSRTSPDLRALLAAPPGHRGGGEQTARALAPLRIALGIDDAARVDRLSRMLAKQGLSVQRIAGAASLPSQLLDAPLDLVIMDTGIPDQHATFRLQQLRQAAGNALHIIVLLPDEAEAQAVKLMLAGASDYLLYRYTEAALIARLSNAQRLISLQGAVRAERELAVSSSGEWAQSNRRLLKEALTDPLTQLPNRRYGLDRFTQEWSIASSNALPIACMMFDIDHFKRVNDEHGHDVGDIVLHQVARVIEACCRRSDIVFRYGGEEFCGICPGTAERQALQLAERIAVAVRDSRYGLREAMFQVTLSIGVAVRTPGMVEPKELIGNADQALYSAKRGGRNQVFAARG